MDTNENKIPEVALIKSTVVCCHSCRAWIARLPNWDTESTGQNCCHKCGATAFVESPGRPWGPGSSEFGLLLKEWQEYMELFADNEHMRERLLQHVVLRGEESNANQANLCLV